MPKSDVDYLSLEIVSTSFGRLEREFRPGYRNHFGSIVFGSVSFGSGLFCLGVSFYRWKSSDYRTFLALGVVSLCFAFRPMYVLCRGRGYRILVMTAGIAEVKYGRTRGWRWEELIRAAETKVKGGQKKLELSSRTGGKLVLDHDSVEEYQKLVEVIKRHLAERGITWVILWDI